MVVIVNYGMGNISSIIKALGRIGVKPIVASDKTQLIRATKIILPGVGNFAHGIKNLKKSNLLDVLHKQVINDKVPILGICLGMQLFTEWGEEGGCEGLGWIKGKTSKFVFENNAKHKVPHIGWNDINIKKKSKLLEKVGSKDQYYFVHSYHVNCNDKADILATTEYGYEFTSIIQKDNIYGTQFHPEKSHDQGIRLLENFIKKI